MSVDDAENDDLLARRTALAAWLGTGAWMLIIALVVPRPDDWTWSAAALLVVPMVLFVPTVCLTCRAVALSARGERLLVVVSYGAAMLLPASLLFSPAPGMYAAIGTLPWLGVTVVYAIVFSRHALRRCSSAQEKLQRLAIACAFAYLAIGAAWLTASRFGLRPLDFDDDIVLLTAVHFHHAGFILPLLAIFAARAVPDRFSWVLVALVLLAMPATAAGITSTHLGGPGWIELFAAAAMAVATTLASVNYVRLVALNAVNAPVLARVCWIFASSCVAIAMVLALLYALRSITPLEFLSVSFMRATHGVLNSIGFSLFGIIGWMLATQSVSE